MKYKDYIFRSSTTVDPKPYWPKILPRFEITKHIKYIAGKSQPERRKQLNISWSIPLRARFVHRYCLEFIATYTGHAKRRRLYVLTLGGPSKVCLQSQVKFKPVEGYWMEN